MTTKPTNFSFSSLLAVSGKWLALCGLLAPWPALAVGSWTGFINIPSAVSNNFQMIILLSDGSVMAQANSSPGSSQTNWYQLTPDNHGSYINGTWKQLASMHYARQDCATEVLKDGRVFFAGDENDGSGGGNAEIYDPLADHWTVLPSAGVGFADAESAMLPDGSVLVSPVAWGSFPQWISTIYHPGQNDWSYPGFSMEYQDECTWVKLPNDSILSIDDAYLTDGEGGTCYLSERFIPALGGWYRDGNVPGPMFSNGETGAGLLLPDGRAFYLGGTGHTALYTSPTSGATNGYISGSWDSGPDIPLGEVASDAPAAMMVNGKILCAVGSTSLDGGSPAPTWFYEYDYTDHTAGPNGTFHAVGSPGNPTLGSSNNFAAGAYQFLNLPDGTILSSWGPYVGLYVYQPDTGPIAAGKPTIVSITSNTDGSYHLAGTLLNGISEGSSFGDEQQNNSNYPIVRMTNSTSSYVYYARTYNWSSTGVQTGTNIVTTEFQVSPTVPAGNYSLVVVANGNASDPVSFTAPVSTWVDFNYNGSTQNGSYTTPFATLAEGVSAVPTGLTIWIKTAGISHETMTISKPMTIRAYNGAATIGE